MYIEKLDVKGFGKLTDRSFYLKKGLNLIYGSNEAGKTTLQWFIRGMLYGLRGAGLPRTGPMQPRRRFMPWSGGQFGGAMLYRLDDGNIYRLERNFDKDTVLIFDGHFNDITGMFGLGRDKQPAIMEKQLGVDEAVFERTALIRQLEVRLDDNSASVLSSRLANASESGFDEVSFDRAEKALVQALKNNTGTGRTAAQPLDRLESQLVRLDAERRRLHDSQKQRDALKMRLLEIHDLRGRLEARKQYLAHIGGLIEIRKTLDLRLEEETGLKEAVRQLRKLDEASAAAVDAGPAQGADSGIYGRGRNNRNRESRLPVLYFIVPALFAVFLVYLMIHGISRTQWPYILVCGAGLMFSGIVSLLMYKKNKDKVIKSANTIKDQGSVFADQAEKAAEAEKTIMTGSILGGASLILGRQLRDPEDLKRELKSVCFELDELSKKLEDGIGKAPDFNSGYARYFDDFNPGKAGYFDPESLEAVLYDSPVESLSEIWKNDNDDVDKQLLDTALNEKYYEGLLGDRRDDSEELLRVEEETVAVREKISYLRHRREALELAHEVLLESGLEVRRTVAPNLNASMSSIIFSLTGGKYADIRGDDKLAVRAALPESGDVREAALLSGATADQMYLALRLAMAGVLTKGGESLPLIMDEVFSQFDDNRTALALKYFNNTYEKGQVLIFTCKQREVELAKEICGGNLNLMEL